MGVLRLANFYIASISIRKTLRAVNVMTVRDFQKEGGGGEGAVHVLSTPSKFLFKI